MANVFLAFLAAVFLVACDGFGGSPSSAAPEASVVAAWDFDGADGGTVPDRSGHGNNAVLRNAEIGPGLHGDALRMNGGNDSIMTIALSDTLRSTAQEITVMGWAYRTADHNVALIAHGYPALFLGFHGMQFKWQVTNTNKGGAHCYADPKHVATLNTWFHVAGTYNGRTARLYVNGEEICSKWLFSGGDIKMPDVPFSVSGYIDDQGKIVDEITGLIDDVRIYNRALSEKDVSTIYASRSTSK